MVNRMRATRSHRNNRRSHHALSPVKLSTCSNCKTPHRSHRICTNCGYYKGKKIIDLAPKKIKTKNKS